MPQSEFTGPHSFGVASAQTVNMYRFVSSTAASTLQNRVAQQTALNGTPVGISVGVDFEGVNNLTNQPAQAGQNFSLMQYGILALEVNGNSDNIAANDRLKSAANGIGIKAGGSDPSWAIALAPAATDGAIIPVFFSAILGSAVFVDPADIAKYVDMDATPETLANADLGDGVTTVDVTDDGATVLNIPLAATANAGRVLIVKKSGTIGATTITPASGTIDGGATYALVSNPGDSAVFVSGGAGDWILVEFNKGKATFLTAPDATNTFTAAEFGSVFTTISSSEDGGQTLNIPSGALAGAGALLLVSKTGTAGAVTITPSAGTIAGSATYALLDAQGDRMLFVSNGTNWLLANPVVA